MLFDLVGVGNPVYDIIITPFSRTDGRVLSGCSTNACLAAKRLGMRRVGLIGSVGRDFARRFTEDIETYGIETNLDTEAEETGGFQLIYDAHGDRTLDVLGVANKITPRDLPEEFLRARYFLIGPILGEVALELVEFIRSSTSAKLFLDPQGLVRVIGENMRIAHRCDQEVFKRIASLVDFIKPNEPESRTITGEKDPLNALRGLSEVGSAVPIVTLAEQGSLILDDHKVHRVPAFATKAIDPTGAGDVYAGSFIFEYDRTGSLTEAGLFASAAASMMVEQVGPSFRLPVETVRERKEAIRGSLATEPICQ